MESVISINLDKQSKIPPYKQIAQQIGEQISNGTLCPGYKLPPERILSEQVGISRGTIKAAYALLDQLGRVETLRGSGSFIAARTSENGSALARREIMALLDKLDSLSIDREEVLAIVQEEIQKRNWENRAAKVAWIDCCAECLSMVAEQIGQMQNVDIVYYQLDDVLDSPARMGSDFDLIVTTPKHYNQICRIAPEQMDKIQKVTMNLDLYYAIEMAKIPFGSRVMTLCNAPIFKRIMLEQLKEFNNISGAIGFTDEDSDDTIKRQLAKTDFLILYREYGRRGRKSIWQAIQKYKQNGGAVILFEYRLDRGSVLHFEELVQETKNKKHLPNSDAGA